MIAAIAAAAVLGAGATPASRPDLVVPSGSVRAADGALTGSFTVRNAGRAQAGRSKAALLVKVAGKNRLVRRFAVPKLGPSASRTISVAVNVPAGLPAGTFPLRACADRGNAVRERSERNNCRRVGQIEIAASEGGGGGSTSSVPTDPVTFTKGDVFTLDSPQSKYWVYVPDGYDESHATPTRLLVWLHGCGGQSEGDIYTVSPGGDQSWISITVGGREGDCWNVDADSEKVLAAVADIKKHFNIAPRRVVIGGFSSGGDLAYRTAFYNANMFAGLLAENTSPFRDTGSSESDSLAAAAWKFNVVHVAHLSDDTYPIDGVRKETVAMKDAGFPITRIERPGGHYDDDTPTTGSDHDLRTYLLPHMNDDWQSP